jgi:hypothetical protein
MTQQNQKTDILSISEWGWLVQLRRTDESTCIEITTPLKAGYSLTVDEQGNVVECISGNFIRIVGGDMIEKTLGGHIDFSNGPSLVKSDQYVALSAPKVHLNPKELEGPLKEEVPSELEEM